MKEGSDLAELLGYANARERVDRRQLDGVRTMLATVTSSTPGNLLVQPDSANTYARTIDGDLPAGHWRLNETTGTSAADSSGNGRTGTYSGSPTLGVAGATADGTGVTFDGVNDLVTVADHDTLDFGSGSFTIEIWYKPPAGVINPQWSFGKGNPYAVSPAVAGAGWAVTHWETGDPINPTLYLGDGVQPLGSLIGPSFTALRGVWTHGVWVIDRATALIRAYKNGAEFSSTAIRAGFGSVSNAIALTIGQGNGNWYTGSLDEVAVYPVALSADRIKSHYDAAALNVTIGPLPLLTNYVPVVGDRVICIWMPDGRSWAVVGTIAMTSAGFSPHSQAHAFSGADHTGTAPSSIMASGSRANVANGATSYGAVLDNGADGFGLEVDREMIMPRAGTAKNLYLRTASAQPATGSLVVTLRKNGVDTALTFTIAASAVAGTFSNLASSVVYAAGDRIALKFVNNATTLSALVEHYSLEYGM